MTGTLSDMGQGGFRLLFALGTLFVALIAAGSAQAAPSCASRLLDDWQDGRIDGTYPVACYQQALATMPEDVRVYSSAEDDITRALQERLGTRSVAVAKPAQQKQDDDGSTSPVLIVLLSALGLVAAASVAAAVR
jgi:hypothetical protein